MYKFILITVLSISIFSQAQANEADIAFKAVDKLFLAMSKINHGDMRAHVTDSFVLLEDGEIWSIDDLINVVNPSETVRINYFSIINSHVHGDLVTVNYWNKANFSNKDKSDDVIWLESVIIEKIKGVWRLSQMHSTRIRPGKMSKGVVFIKQEI